MSDQLEIRQLPSVDERVETGPVKFGEDWPGLHIRGDAAMYFSMALSRYKSKEEPDVLTRCAVGHLIELLDSCLLYKR